MELKDLKLKKLNMVKPPCFGQKLLLVGVFRSYNKFAHNYDYTPAIVTGELEYIRKDELGFNIGTSKDFIATEYAELDTEQGLLFENLVRHQKQIDNG